MNVSNYNACTVHLRCNYLGLCTLTRCDCVGHTLSEIRLGTWEYILPPCGKKIPNVNKFWIKFSMNILTFHMRMWSFTQYWYFWCTVKKVSLKGFCSIIFLYTTVKIKMSVKRLRESLGCQDYVRSFLSNFFDFF